MLHTRTITPAPPPETTPQQTTALIVFWLTIVLALAGVGFAWSNHFQSGFHSPDEDTILANPAIRTFANAPHFFADPGLFSAQMAHAAYRPLVSLIFTVDYALRGAAEPVLFQIQNYVWFCIVLGLLYFFLRLIPGGGHYPSLFGAALFALHPVLAGSLNDAVNIGTFLGAAGVLGGLIIAIVWPDWMPAHIDLGAPKVPKSEWDLFRLKAQPRVTRWYSAMRRTRIAFYMIPVAFGLIADPSAAVFAPLLAVYMWLFQPEKDIRRIRIPGAVCLVYWLAQAAAVWRYGANTRLPLAGYWFTQPLVALRAVVFFLVPYRLNPVSTLGPVEHLWSPMALAGYAGLGLLVWLAWDFSHREEWRAVAFGIWWFLIALAPSALLPAQHVEWFPNSFFATAGLAFAVSRAVAVFGARYKETKWRIPLLGAGLAASLALLSVLLGQTLQANSVWQTDQTLWKDMVDKNPNDAPSLTHYAKTLMDSEDADFFNIRLDAAYAYLKKAVALSPRDPEALTDLAVASEQKVLDAEAEQLFRQAIQAGPNYAPAYALYGRYLQRRGKLKEAMDMARKGVALDPTSIEAWQTVAETYIATPDWKDAIDAANEILRINPDSADGQRALKVAEAGLTARDTAETVAAKEPSVPNFLALSVVYYNEKRYEDAVRACQEGLKLDPTVAELYVNMATAYHAMGKSDEGIAALEAAGKLRPDFTFIKTNIQWEIEHKGKPRDDVVGH